jgi:hypothetical protein
MVSDYMDTFWNYYVDFYLHEYDIITRIRFGGYIFILLSIC